MKDIKLTVGEGSPTQEEVLVRFDREIEDFSAFMASIPDWRVAGPLNNGEKALLKTFLVHKYREKF